METKWTNYMSAIGMTRPFIDRVEVIAGFFEQLLQSEVLDIFVTDYLDKEGNRQYESLWLFTADAVMEAKQFLEEDNYDFCPLKGCIDYWVVKKVNFDFDKSSSDSRLLIGFTTTTGNKGTLKASGGNCEYLKAVFLSHIVPSTAKI